MSGRYLTIHMFGRSKSRTYYLGSPTRKREPNSSVYPCPALSIQQIAIANDLDT
jgi:hypothetical protein